MASINEKVVEAAWAGMRGEVALPATAGRCLQLVRTVIEHALGLPPDGFYQTFLVGHAKAQPRHTGWWARDAEHILRAQGMAVHVAQPGDLLFKNDVAEPFGHAALLLDHDLVLENCVRKYRPHSYYLASQPEGAIALTPFDRFPSPTTVVRLKA